MSPNQPQGLEAGMTLEYVGTEEVDRETMNVVSADARTDEVELTNDTDDEDTFTAPLGKFWSFFPSWSVVDESE